MSPSVSVRLLLTQGDERLMAYARHGHERAFEALVQRYRRQLLGYCRRLLLSDEHAEDVLQQALLQAWVALRDGAEVRHARPWLYRIVHNVAVNALRTSRYDYCKLSESLCGADAPQDDLERRIVVREALAGLAALPEMQREALLRTAVEGRSHQQAATDLGVSEPALRGLVYRARTALRAAAGAIVPPPLLGWALETGTPGSPALEGLAGVAGGGTAGLAGLLVKGSAVVVTAGALAGGIVTSHTHGHAAQFNAQAPTHASRSGVPIGTDGGASQPIDLLGEDRPRHAATGSVTIARHDSRRRSMRVLASTGKGQTRPEHPAGASAPAPLDARGQSVRPWPSDGGEQDGAGRSDQAEATGEGERRAPQGEGNGPHGSGSPIVGIEEAGGRAGSGIGGVLGSSHSAGTGREDDSGDEGDGPHSGKGGWSESERGDGSAGGHEPNANDERGEGHQVAGDPRSATVAAGRYAGELGEGAVGDLLQGLVAHG